MKVLKYDNCTYRYYMNQSIAKVLNNKLVLLVVSVLFGFGAGTLFNMMLWLIGISYDAGLMGDVIMVVALGGGFFFVVGEKAEMQCKKTKN